LRTTPALKDTALIVTGQLQPVDHGTRAQRTSVNFGGGVGAVITVSRVSEGTKAQLLTFTAQAQKSTAFTGPAAASHSASIKAVLAGQSVPTQNLSPDVEAQALGLGRAVADKINAYAIQQGWVNKADLPERPVDTKPEKNRPQKQPVTAAKQGESMRPSNTIPCNAFTKNERGNWYVRGPVTIDVGNAENKTLQNLEITPKFFTVGGVDLYEAVQKKCGSNQRP
jgi:stage V sporulation protein SpoVS